uniref:Protein FAR1-RELATED SEQUENCE n=1 Tax=Chenopodium quinoa TaxID=63459 RepID=A0A803N405_CHEQI
MNEIHSKLPNEAIPMIEMEFASENIAYDFYNIYSRAIGFGIRLSKFHRDDNTGTILDRIICCSFKGSRGKDKRAPYVKKNRALTRVGCSAMIKVSSRINGLFRIIKFEPQHNHVLSTPSKTHLFRSHKSINSSQASELDTSCSYGIAPKASMELMSRRAGGRDNLGFLRVDCNNYLRKKREKEMKVGDTGGVLEYLQRKQTDDPKFFYAIQVDVDDLITNIFWADARMMSDYDYFGDVVCFDITCKKQKDGRPFAMFVGVNHHKQTIIFGVALLYDETTKTFNWIFDTFVKAMHGKKPKTILTDQDQAMANALSTKWPETYHRLCVWHMYQNAAKHLHHVFEKFKDFAKYFSSCVYDYDDEADFIDAWDNMLVKYDLVGNSWLEWVYNLREKWALVYGRQTFCADMSTTQRSERVAAQSEDTYKWALDVHQKSLAEVEARLKKLICGEEDDNEEESLDCEENVNVELQCDTLTVKGIKMRGSSPGSRGRGRGNGSNNGSTRCKSSLEKGRTRKKHCTNDQVSKTTFSEMNYTPTSERQMDYTIPLSNNYPIAHFSYTTPFFYEDVDTVDLGSGSLTQLLNDDESHVP